MKTRYSSHQEKKIIETKQHGVGVIIQFFSFIKIEALYAAYLITDRIKNNYWAAAVCFESQFFIFLALNIAVKMNETLTMKKVIVRFI